MKKPYDFFYKRRGLLMLPPCLFILLIVSYETEHAAYIWPAGLGLFFVGVALRIWAQMHLHYRLSVRKNLTTTGPYSFVRNPIYLANTTMLLGLTVLSELLWFLPVMLLWCAVVYTFVVKREEAHLAEKYGAPYVAFLENVPRWMPRVPLVTPLRAGVRRFAVQSVVAELHCLLWIVPFIIKELWTY